MTSEGGSGTDVFAVWVEIDDLDATPDAVRAGAPDTVYGPADEPWSARRFAVRAPSDHVVNVLGNL